ncbi:MAG: secondary thiamine-phosphate synthase enzyme YjbQ [Pseudomonadales bacterium]
MLQQTVNLRARSRGFHLVTDELVAAVPALATVKQGVVHFFIQHSSASLTINENADPDVRGDMERHFLQAVPENAPYYAHTLEGADDMPAHIKASLLGSSVSVPLRDGQLLLGTWQGIWLGEHREHGGARSVVVTVL